MSADLARLWHLDASQLDPTHSSQHELTDWFYVSPHRRQLSPLQDALYSTSRTRETEACLHYLYDPQPFLDDFNFSDPQQPRPMHFPSSDNRTYPSSIPPAIFNSHHRMLSLDSTTTTLFNTPSPPAFGFLSPTLTAVQPQAADLDTSSSSPLFSAFTHIEELSSSPFGCHFDLSLPRSLLCCESDISPVVRAPQAPPALPPQGTPKPVAKPNNGVKRSKRNKPDNTPTFMEKICSAPDQSDVVPLVPLRLKSSSPLSLQVPSLQSPCQLNPLGVYYASSPFPEEPVESEVLSAKDQLPQADESILNLITPLRLPDPAPLSPLTPLTPSSSFVPHTSVSKSLRPKRRLADTSSPLIRRKRLRSRALQLPDSSSASSSSDASTFSSSSSPASSPPLSSSMSTSNVPTFSMRTLPVSIPISSKFPLFYRRFPASSYFQALDAESPCTLFDVRHPGGNYNMPRGSLDLYTPRFVKGRGTEKVGMCPICVEPAERGGENKKLWLAMKFSAFKCYHMQYAHGVSASTGRPFSPPTSFRVVERPKPGKNEKTHIQQGKCHKCDKWVAVEGIKDLESKVKELHWWKHAASCHQGSSILGEGDVYEDDYVLQRLLELEN